MKRLNYALLPLSLERSKPSIKGPCREDGVWPAGEQRSLAPLSREPPWPLSAGSLRPYLRPAQAPGAAGTLLSSVGQPCLWREAEDFHFVTLKSNAGGTHEVLLQD